MYEKASTPTVRQDSPAGEEHLRIDLINQLYSNVPFGLIASAANSLIVFFILSHHISLKLRSIWLTSILLIIFVRYLCYLDFQRTIVSRENAAKFGRRFLLGVGASGIAWGAIALFLFPTDSVIHQVFIIFILGGMVAGAAASYSAQMKAFLFFSVPALLPLSARCFVIGDKIHLAMAGAIMLYLLLISGVAMHIHKITLNSLRLKYENLHLVRYLASAKENAERLNEELTQEIQRRLKTEEEQIKHKEGLEELIKERTAELMEVNEKLKKEIERRNRMEKELLKIQKLESLGVLAGGIAHDFNNLLTVILGNITLVKHLLPQEHKVQQRLTNAERASLRARDLTQQLLTFSKGGAPVKKPSNIFGVVKDTASFILQGTNIKCEFKCSDNLWSVEIDESQISQAIQNIMLNAKQAMPQGGTITITCENFLKTVEALPLEKGKYIRITIKDEGLGIPSEYLEKIFDPFFTTKHQCNGLGLTITYSIIKKHHGHITVDSSPGNGTAFTIYLPASERSLPLKSPKQVGTVAGKGRILIMDDEEMVLDLLYSLLTEMGYEAVITSDGEKAIHIYKEAKEKGNSFDLVILDLTVPGGLGGKEVIKALKKIDPEVKAVVSSGYSNDPVMADYEKYGFKGVIVKPYVAEEMIRVLNSFLGTT